MSKKRELNISKENIGNKKSILVELDTSLQIVEFEINMLQNNPSLPFLELKQLQIDDRRKIIYDVGSKECLNEFICSSDLSKSVLLDIIESIYKIIRLCKEFMLDNNKIVLNLDYVYIDKNSSLVYMIFLPIDIENENLVEEEFKTISKKILTKLKSSRKILTSTEKKLISTLNKKSCDLKYLEQIFQAYDDEKNSKNRYEVSTFEEDEYDTSEVGIKTEETINGDRDKVLNNNKYNKTINKESIIEENYENIDGIDLSYVEDDEEDQENDEDLKYKEYKEIQRFEQSNKNNRLNKILILQLVVVMLIGSLVLVFSVNDKEYFIMMAAIMVFVLLLLIILIIMTFRKMRK